jgi:DNA-binding CsgD family transcriptional regulator
MSSPATKPASTMRLRVAIYAADSSRRIILTRILGDAGYEVVGARDAADIVLADGDSPAAEIRPIVVLGGGDGSLPGLLSRNADANQIDAALRAVAAGLIVRSPSGTEAGFRPMRENDVRELLTPRELEVLAAIAEGLTNKAVARRLDISLHTVKFHIESVFRKLGARTRTEAVTKALESRSLETFTL